MVFQDGGSYLRTNGEFRTTVVFDNLIHKKEMPVTIGIFINPGEFPAAEAGAKGRSNRSFEYDSLGDTYAKFVLEEMLTEVGKNYNLVQTAEGRAIGGISSGGICAFTVAWERPTAFSKVLSHVGSFTNIRGGHVYHALIRKTESKPFRIFLQDGQGISIICMGTGRWLTRRWPPHSSMRSTITSLFSETEDTTGSTVVC